MIQQLEITPVIALVKWEINKHLCNARLPEGTSFVEEPLYNSVVYT